MLEANQAVVDECAAVRAFQALLMQEREALVHGQTECIEHLSVEKAQLAQALECATRAREQAISNGFGSADEDALTRWLVEDPAAPALWRELMALAGRIREQNRLNGLLIERGLLHARRSLSMLGTAMPGGLPLYGANGLPSVASGETHRISV